MINDTKETKKEGKEEKQLRLSIKKTIKERTNSHIEQQIKTGNTHIDESAIEKKCSEDFFQELEDFMTSVSKDIEKFFVLLEEDDPKLCSEIKEALQGENEAVEQATSFQEIVDSKKAHKIQDDLLDKVYEIAVRHYNSHDLEKTFLYFNWLCISDDENSQMWFMKGVVLLNQKKFNDAVMALQQAIALDSSYIAAYVQMMNCFILMEDLDNAKITYQSFNKDFDPKTYRDDKLIQENLQCIKQLLYSKNP